jgi:hypothetical protein
MSGGKTVLAPSGVKSNFRLAPNPAALHRRRANGRNRRILVVAVRSGEGPLTEHITATQAQPPERVFMPLSGRCLVPRCTSANTRGH